MSGKNCLSSPDKGNDGHQGGSPGGMDRPSFGIKERPFKLERQTGRVDGREAGGANQVDLGDGSPDTARRIFQVQNNT